MNYVISAVVDLQTGAELGAICEFSSRGNDSIYE